MLRRNRFPIHVCAHVWRPVQPNHLQMYDWQTVCQEAGCSQIDINKINLDGKSFYHLEFSGLDDCSCLITHLEDIDASEEIFKIYSDPA